MQEIASRGLWPDHPHNKQAHPDNLPGSACVLLSGALSRRRIITTTACPAQHRESVMKLRLVVISAALLVFSASASFAQTQNPQAQSPTNQTVSTGAPQSGQSTPASGQSAPTAQPGAASSSAQTPPPPVAEPDPSKVKHDGGKDDVDAIGNRKVGGRGLGDWYSLETEIRMGKQYSMMIESSSKMVNDPVVTEYVNRIGQNLVRNSDAQVPFTIKVIDSDVVNA